MLSIYFAFRDAERMLKVMTRVMTLACLSFAFREQYKVVL